MLNPVFSQQHGPTMQTDDAVGAWPLPAISESRASSPASVHPSQQPPEATTSDPASASDDEYRHFLYWRLLQQQQKQQQQQQDHGLQGSPSSSQHSTPKPLPPPPVLSPTQLIQQQEHDGYMPSTEQQNVGRPASPFSPSTAELLHQLQDLQDQLTSKSSHSCMGHSNTEQPSAAPSPARAVTAQGAPSSMQPPAEPASVNSSASSTHAGSTAQIEALLQTILQRVPGQGSPAAAASPCMHAGTGEASAQACSQEDDNYSHLCAVSEALGPPSTMQVPAAAPNPWSAQEAAGSAPVPAGAQTPAAAAVSTTAPPVGHKRWAAGRYPPDAAAASVSAAQGTAALVSAQGCTGISINPAMRPPAPAALAVSAQRGASSTSAQPQSLLQAIMAWQEGAQAASPDSSSLAVSPPVCNGPREAVAGTAASSTMPAPYMLLQHPPSCQPGAVHLSCSAVEALQPAQLPGSALQGVPQGFPSLAGFDPVGLGPVSTCGFGFGYSQQPQAVQQHAAPAPASSWGGAYHGPAGLLAPTGIPAQPLGPPAGEAPLDAQHAQQQQQLQQLLRLQQLQMLQMHMQLQAVAGAAAPGPFPLSPGLQPAPMAPMWGLQPPALLPGMLPAFPNPAMMQQLQQQLLSQQLAAMGFPAGAAAAPAHVSQYSQQAGHMAASTGAAPGDRPAQDPAVANARLCGSPFGSVQQQAMQAGPGEPAHRVSTDGAGVATAAAAKHAPSGFATAGRSISAGSWLGRWMPLRKSLSCRRSSSSTAGHAAPQHQHSADGCASSLHAELSQVESIPPPGTAEAVPAGVFWFPARTGSARSESTPSTMLQCALYPVTAPLAAAYGASSLAVHLVLSVGRTVSAASAWSVHSTALVFVTVSQYQLLALLYCLAAFAAAAEAASTGAGAALTTGRLVLHLAGREGRLFGRAAAVVAFTDVKQLCRILATQPLLLLHGMDHPGPGSPILRTSSAQLPAAQDLRPSDYAAGSQPVVAEGGVAPLGGRSLSRGLSSLLGGLFAVPPAASRQQSKGQHSSSMQLMPSCPSASSSRRSSGHWAVDHTLQGQAFEAEVGAAGVLPAAASAATSPVTSQELMVNPPVSSIFNSQAVPAEMPRPGVAGVARSTLIVYDSLAVVSGLWAGMWLRLWLLLILQGPAASCRIWLHAIQTGCHMSAAAAGASAQTVLQVAWYLSRLSLAVLGSAKADAAAATAAPAPAGVTPGSSSTRLHAMPSLVLSVLPLLQWVWLQLFAAWASCGSYLRLVMSAAGPRGKALADVLGSGYTHVSSAFTALAAAASSLGLWVHATHQRHGKARLFSKTGLQDMGIRSVWLAGQLAAWAMSCAFALLERVAGYVAEWAMRDMSPVGRAAVYGSAGMIKGLVVEAGRQSSLLAMQLFAVWRAHDA